MIMKYFSQIPPKIPSSVRNPTCSTVVRGVLTPFEVPARSYAEKDKHHHHKGHKAREESVQVRIPGFVQPETMSDEGYFTQKARQQIEEMKKKQDKPSLNNPEKKD